MLKVYLNIFVLAVVMIGGRVPAVAARCLEDEKEFTLAGLRLNDPAEMVVKLLGRPVKTLRGRSEDDGGTYEITTLVYPTLKVSIARGVVDEIRTSSGNVKTPSGLRAGIPLTRVSEVLGREPGPDLSLGILPEDRKEGTQRLLAYSCNGERFIAFRVTNGGIVKEVLLGTYHP